MLQTLQFTRKFHACAWTTLALYSPACVSRPACKPRHSFMNLRILFGPTSPQPKKSVEGLPLPCLSIYCKGLKTKLSHAHKGMMCVRHYSASQIDVQCAHNPGRCIPLGLRDGPTNPCLTPPFPLQIDKRDPRSQPFVGTDPVLGSDPGCMLDWQHGICHKGQTASARSLRASLSMSTEACMVVDQICRRPCG